MALRFPARATLPLALLIGSGFAAFLLFSALNNVLEQERGTFNNQVALVNENLLQHLNAIDEALHGVRSLYNASTHVDADEFRIIAEDILSRHTYLQSLMYMPLVSDIDRDSYEESIRDKGHFTFAILKRESNRYFTADQHPNYFPIQYIEPFTPKNIRTLGFDILSEPFLEAPISQAIHSAETSFNHQYQFGKKKISIAFMSLYSGKMTPKTVEQRASSTNGLIAFTLEPSKILENTLSNDRMTVSLSARPINNSNKIVKLAAETGKLFDQSKNVFTHFFDNKFETTIGNQTFIIDIKKSIHLKEVPYGSIIIAGITGFIFTFLLMGLSWVMTKRAAELQSRNQEINKLVNIRTHELAQANNQLQKTTEDLRREKHEQQILIEKLKDTQSQLLQSEKMASIGQLAAGVAHEINNPIGFVNSNFGSLKHYVNDILTILDKYENATNELQVQHEEIKAFREVSTLLKELDIDYIKQDLIDLIKESEDGLDRVKKIVQDLKDFSRVDATEWQIVDLHQGIESTLNIVNNEIKYKAEIVKEYGDLPEVECMPSQINQVIMNLIVNASHAIENHGTITIRTGSQGDWIWLEVQDTGKGISEKDKAKIFDPFFTTKPIGEGTGLGLSVSFGIVEKHHGRIQVESECGKGTSFRIWLPVQQSEDHSKSA